jgi:hypothetical protein
LGLPATVRTGADAAAAEDEEHDGEDEESHDTAELEGREGLLGLGVVVDGP